MPNSNLGNPVYQSNFSSCSALLFRITALLVISQKLLPGSVSGNACLVHASNLYKLHMDCRGPKPLVWKTLAIPGIST